MFNTKFVNKVMKKKKGSCYFFGKAREKVWQMMKLRMVLIIFLVGLTSLPTMAQDQTVTLKLTDVNLYELFDAIRKQTGLRFLYNAEQMKEVPIEKLIKETNGLIRAAAYKKRIEVQNKENYEAGLEAVQSMVFETMAKDNPELYRQVSAYLNKKKSEGMEG